MARLCDVYLIPYPLDRGIQVPIKILPSFSEKGKGRYLHGSIQNTIALAAVGAVGSLAYGIKVSQPAIQPATSEQNTAIPAERS
jgi:hypothetical protein